MTITFVCQSCEDSFDVEYSQLSEESKGLKCPNCGKKLSASETDDFVTALDEVLAQVAALRKRFVITFDVDGEDLPPPYDADMKKAVRGDDEDEDEDVEDDEDALEGETEEDEDERF
jgi:DNA-directed RNA polymerase subunit RPC12/RpoP